MPKISIFMPFLKIFSAFLPFFNESQWCLVTENIPDFLLIHWWRTIFLSFCFQLMFHTFLKICLWVCIFVFLLCLSICLYYAAFYLRNKILAM